MAERQKHIGTFAAAMTIVGAMIGAGFASWQEIWTFFGFAGWISIFFVVPLFLLLLLTIIVALKTQAESFFDLGKFCFGKYAILAELVFAFCCFCLLSGMIAGLRTLCEFFTPLFLISFCMIGIMLFFGFDGIVKINTWLLPFLIVFLCTISIFTIIDGSATAQAFSAFNVFKLSGNCVLYVCMNTLLSLPVILQLGKSCRKKTLAAVVACSLICILFALAVFALIFSCEPKNEMPILEICFNKSYALGIVCIVFLVIATLTTIFSCGLELVNFAQKRIKNRAFCVIFVLFVASLFSLLGFEKIVECVYPILGALGFILFLIALASLVKKRNSFKQLNQ